MVLDLGDLLLLRLQRALELLLQGLNVLGAQNLVALLNFVLQLALRVAQLLLLNGRLDQLLFQLVDLLLLRGAYEAELLRLLNDLLLLHFELFGLCFQQFCFQVLTLQSLFQLLDFQL